MAFEVFFDSPEHYNNKFDFYSCGASPNLVKQLLKYLDKNVASLSEIHIALYLFNNTIIHEKLIALAEKGVQVNVYTIPIEGYDAESPKNIIDINTGKIVANSTKYDLAKNIFSGHYCLKYKNYNLFIFPHMYLRSPNLKTFSRGNMPYSLHTKSFLFTHKNGICDLALSSSNFAVRDMVKEENLLFIYNEKDYNDEAVHFFGLLRKHSIHISDYDFKGDFTKYSIEHTEYNYNENGGFMAPFYFNSSFIIEENLKASLQNARERIIVVGQHVCPVDYEFDASYHTGFNKESNKRNGLVNELIQKSKENVAVEILSQTFASGNFEVDSKFRSPANRFGFIKFFDKINQVENINYYVNEHCHNKYIIIDNSVFISTFNYTPTQFIYLDAVKIDEFLNNPGKSYEGIYAEVGQFVLVNDPVIAGRYVDNFNKIKCSNATTKVK